MAGLAQSKEGGQAMARASETLSLFSDSKKKSTAPTVDHLIEAEKRPEQPAPKVSGSSDPKAGSFERLTAMFGGGARFTLPNGTAT